MTPSELQVLDIVRATLAATAVTPTYSEIAAATGRSPNSKGTICSIVDSLVAQGHLVRDRHRKRGLALPNQPSLAAVTTESLLTELRRRERAGEFKAAA